MDDPLLRLAGRQGRLAVLSTLQGGGTWNLRGLARAAGVPLAAAQRAVAELQAVAAVTVERPGRDARITWRPGPAAAFLSALRPPDLAAAVEETFAAAYAHRARVVGHGPPRSLPARIAIVVDQDEDAANDAIGPALDAVAEAGLPLPDVATVPRSMLQDDPVSRAIRAGRLLRTSR